MTVIDTIFQPIYGKKCWNVENGWGSFLTFEFGEPHFKVVREPYSSKSQKPRVIRQAARRLVSIYGDWKLWIKYCEWSFYRNDVFIGNLLSFAVLFVSFCYCFLLLVYLLEIGLHRLQQEETENLTTRCGARRKQRSRSPKAKSKK